MIFKIDGFYAQNAETPAGPLSLLLASWTTTISASLDKEMTIEKVDCRQELSEETKYEDAISDLELKTRKCLRGTDDVQLSTAHHAQEEVNRYVIKSGFAKKCTGKASIQRCSPNRSVSMIAQGTVTRDATATQRRKSSAN